MLTGSMRAGLLADSFGQLNVNPNFIFGFFGSESKQLALRTIQFKGLCGWTSSDHESECQMFFETVIVAVKYLIRKP